MNAIGIDISAYQVSYNPVTKPVDFIIQRVSYGTTKDARFDSLYPAVRQVPIHGCYQYLRSSQDWKAQADRMLSIIFDAGADFHFYACDVESYGNVVDAKYAGMAMAWMEYVEKETKKPVLLYTNTSTYISLIEKYQPIRAGHFQLWLAQYPTPLPQYPQSAYPYLGTMKRRDWLFWQYGSTADGREYGTGSNHVDVNLANGNVDYVKLKLGIKPEITETELDKIKKELASIRQDLGNLQEKVEEFEEKWN